MSGSEFKVELIKIPQLEMVLKMLNISCSNALHLSFNDEISSLKLLIYYVHL